MIRTMKRTYAPLRTSLLVLAIAAITGGCSHEDPADVQASTQTPAKAETAGTDHLAAPPIHDDAYQPTDAHAEHASASAAPPALPATPWPSDAPLREGMRRMHRAVEALGHAEHGHLDATQTSAAAQQVQDAANYMFANCKLTPEPDAALHGVLATLIGGAAAIKTNPANTSPVASMRDALALYPRMFDDATWQADTTSAK